MTRNAFIFIGTFLAGALIALVARAALFEPHAGHEGHPPAGGDYDAMVNNTLSPASKEATQPGTPKALAQPAPVSADPHAGHAATASGEEAAERKPVNTVCAICGMGVNPKIPTQEYQGKTIGFGCKMCPPKFTANPDRYGPSYLRNEVFQK
ncbi:MAG: hypothetical protein F9K30_23105 [Dechloromonas sp.]|nr:MAG: hypothetical protein F9K30_23105 [Dechloromonas sp.]